MASMPTIYISPGGGEGISHASRHPPPSGGPALTGRRDTSTFKGAYSESRTAPAHARTTRTDCWPRLSRSCSPPPSCCLGRCLGYRLGHCKQGARSARTRVLSLILLLLALPVTCPRMRHGCAHTHHHACASRSCADHRQRPPADASASATIGGGARRSSSTRVAPPRLPVQP